MSSAPWTHKRLRALEVFARSELYTKASGVEVDDPLDREELERRTRLVLGVS